MANKELNLFKEIIPAVDFGITDLYDAATEVGRKDINGDLWNLNRWISNVSGNYKKQALAVFKVNNYYNKNYNDIQKEHKKLLWMILCVAGKSGKKEFHPWIKLERKKDTNDKFIKVLSKIYPNMKWEEVELLARISPKKEIIELAREYGFDDFE